MPRPPSQIFGIAPRLSSKRSQSVATWYSRAPMMPAPTPQMAIALTSSVVPAPFCSSSRPHSHTAAITPSAIIRP